MKKYLVKSTHTATAENPSFAGKVCFSLSGKGDEFIEIDSHIGSYEKYWIADHGYNRERDAKRNWSFKNPENTKYWSTTVEIVCLDV